MSKRSISQVSNPVQNMNQKKMKSENRPATKEEVDFLMTSLRKSAEDAKKNKCKNLTSFQREIDELIQKFREDMETLNSVYFTRQDIKKYEMTYLLRNRNLIDYLNCFLQTNKYLTRDFYLKNTCKIIQNILWASQSALGKLVGEHYPSWKTAVENKIREMSVPRLSEDTESMKEVQELRGFANRVAREVQI